MRVLIYGTGAVGGYFAARLGQAGHTVATIVREATVGLIRAEGLFVTEAGSNLHTMPDQVTTAEEALAGDASYDLTIMTVKGYDLAAAAQALAGSAVAPGLILVTQNGIGHEECLAHLFGSDRVLSAALTIPITREASNRLVVEKPGRGMGLAAVDQRMRVDGLADTLRAAGITVGARRDYRAMKWSKAFLNIGGNASAAILNRSPGMLYRTAAIYELELRMMREALAVMRAKRIAVVDLPRAPIRFLATTARRAPAFIARPVLTQVIDRGRGDKMPSFHIDLVSGRRRSEVEFHNGAIAAAGAAAGVPTPVNRTLNELLLGMAAGNIDPAAYDGDVDRLLAEVAFYDRGSK